jgi:hypothetical protein
VGTIGAKHAIAPVLGFELPEALVGPLGQIANAGVELGVRLDEGGRVAAFLVPRIGLFDDEYAVVPQFGPGGELRL